MKSKILFILAFLVLFIVGCSNNNSNSENQYALSTAATTQEQSTINDIPTTPSSLTTTSSLTTASSSTTSSTTTITSTTTSKNKTIILSSFAIDIPSDWSFSDPVHYDGVYPTVLTPLEGKGDFHFDIEECLVKNNLTDEEIFDKRIEQLWTEETCINVDIFSSHNIKYAVSSYSDNPNFHIYTFAQNGYCYQFDVNGQNLILNFDEILEQLFSSIRFNESEIVIDTAPSFNTLSADNQQIVVLSIMRFNWEFTYPRSISINKMSSYSEGGDKMYLYELYYQTKDNQMKTETFLYNYSQKLSTTLGQTYEEAYNSISNVSNIYEINEVSAISASIQEYFSNI